MNTNIIAKVDGREVTEQDLHALVQNLGQNAARFSGPEGRKQLVEELITQELFYSDALEKGLDKDAEFIAALDSMKNNLLKQYALSKLLSSITVSDEEAEAYFNAHTEMFKPQPSATASHILVSTQEEAEKILTEINEGLDFAEAASKYSSCPSNARGGDLGQFQKGQMVPEFEEAVFSMQPDEISAPVQTQFGFHIIKAGQVNEATDVTFEEVKENVKRHCAQVKSNEIYLNKQTELKAKYPVEIIEA